MVAFKEQVLPRTEGSGAVAQEKVEFCCLCSREVLPHCHPPAERLQLAPTLVLAAPTLLAEYSLLQVMDLGLTPSSCRSKSCR